MTKTYASVSARMVSSAQLILEEQDLEELNHMNGHSSLEAVERSSDSEQPRSAEARRISCVCVARPENDGEDNETLDTTNKRIVLHTPKAALRYSAPYSLA